MKGRHASGVCLETMAVTGVILLGLAGLALAAGLVLLGRPHEGLLATLTGLAGTALGGLLGYVQGKGRQPAPEDTDA